MTQNNIPLKPLPLRTVKPGVQIRKMLLDRGFSVSGWARFRGIRAEEGRMMVNQGREYPQHRRVLATDLGLSIEGLYALLPWPPEQEAVEDNADADHEVQGASVS